jgi:hypothetical protein
MSIQQESDVYNRLPNQPSIVGTKHNSAMQCANPRCSKELLYLREGTLKLLEMESHSDDQFRSDVGAFATRSVPSKYFWLCGECTKTLIVKRWTTSGLDLVLRNQKTAGSHPNMVARPATAATTRPPPVSLTVPPMPPMGTSASVGTGHMLYKTDLRHGLHDVGDRVTLQLVGRTMIRYALEREPNRGWGHYTKRQKSYDKVFFATSWMNGGFWS